MKKLLRSLFILLFVAFSASAQNRTITGTVTAQEDGMPIPGVSVKVKGTTIGVSTDATGKFAISVPSSATTLEISSIGFVMRSLPIGSSNVVNVALLTDSKALGEVVVTGYGNLLKEKFTGSSNKVDSKAIENIPMASFDQILQGRAPGLYVAAGSGQPGSSARVTIRGIGSISGTTTPLYIVDGVPIESGAFSTMNPNDFESVDVLKDAAATAIYGSRGSNGVIVVNTKRGKSGELNFGYNTQFGFSNRTTPRFEMLNSKQRIQFEEEVGLESGRTIGPGWYLSPNNPANAGLSAADKAFNANALDSLRNSSIDWTDYFFRTGKMQQHEVNASGGGESVRFYTSVSYLNQEGIANDSYLERYTLRNNLDFKHKRLSGSLNATAGYSNSRFIVGEASTAIVNPFAAAHYALPYEKPYINGTLYHTGNIGTSPLEIFDFREGSDALERASSSLSKSNQIKATVNGKLAYEITTGLTASTLFGLDFRETNGTSLIRPGTYSGSQVSNGRQGSLSENLVRNLQMVSTSMLRYSKNINNLHDFDLQGIFETTANRYKTFTYTGFGINPKLIGTPAGITPGSATGFIPTIGGGRTQNLLVSIMGVGRYTYNDKYTISASYRYDGSSTVPDATRWKGFYSFGANWNVKKENFLEEVNWLNGLRLRASYGLTASPFSSDFAYLPTYSNTRYASVTGVFPNAPGNPAYDWEYTKQLDIGVDFEMLDSRVRGGVDFYNKDVNNLFISQSLSGTSGFSSLSVNAGSLYNKGVDGHIQGDVIRNTDFRLTFGVNANYNKNQITDLGEVTEFIQGTSIIRVGLPLGTHFIPGWAGVNPANGNPQYYNLDGSVTSTYDRTAQSAATFGTYQPNFQGGFNTSLDYKGVFFEAFFTFANNVTRYNNEDFFNENVSFGTSNQSTMVLDRWRKPGDITNVQRYGSARQFSSKDLQDASFLRFRNFTIGYRIPESIVQRTKVLRAATVSLQGQNLYTWTSWRGFDPEDNNNIATFEYPNPRTFTFGINLKF